MKPSPESKVRGFYDDAANWYAEAMDAEIELPLYSDVLGRLAGRIAGVPGADFFLLFRLYGPEFKAFFKTWTLGVTSRR